MYNSANIYIDHRIAELEGVEFELLNSQKKLLQAVQQVADDLKLTVVNSFVHRFEPHGLSLVLVISQSHIAIHTWPEYGYMHLDIVTCSEDKELSHFEETLKKHFSPTEITTKKINY